MIISHKYKFIFIKTRKTAGTSIEVFLSQQCGVDDVVTPITPHVEPHVARNYRGFFNPIPELIEARGKGAQCVIREWKHRRKFYNHIPAYKVRGRISKKIWRNYFKFAVERNPWDKTLSLYHHIKHRRGGNLSFDEYLSEGKFCINYPLYTEPCTYRVMLDKVIKYEHLQNELSKVFSMLGVSFDGALNVNAKSQYRQDRRPYQEVFTSDQRSIIEKAFDYEIRLHGYSF